jgi:exosome complex component RRP40
VTEALGKYFKFELTVGMNGRVWVNSGSVVQVIAITSALEKSESMTDDQCRHMVDSIAERR